MKRPVTLLLLVSVLGGFALGWFAKASRQRVAVDEQRLAHELDAAAQAALALGALDRSDTHAATAVLERRLVTAVDHAYDLSRPRQTLAEFPAPHLAAAMLRAAQHAERTGRVSTAARARALAAKLAASR